MKTKSISENSEQPKSAPSRRAILSHFWHVFILKKTLFSVNTRVVHKVDSDCFWKYYGERKLKYLKEGDPVVSKRRPCGLCFKK